MTITFSVSDVRQFKGAAISCLILLALSPLPVAQEWLERNSGYTDKPVSQALSYLAELGRVVRTRSGWHLTDSSVQLALGMVDEIEELSTVPTPGRSTGYPQDIHSASRKNSESRKNSDSSAPIIIIDSDSVKNREDNNKNSQTSRKNSDSGSPKIWAALAKVGVFKNERTEAMINKPHVTVEYIEGLAKQMQKSGKCSNNHPGLFISLCERCTPVERELTRSEEIKAQIEAFKNRGR